MIIVLGGAAAIVTVCHSAGTMAGTIHGTMVGMTHGTVHGMTHGMAHGTTHGILLGTMVAAIHATIITGTTLGITDAITATLTDLGDLMTHSTLVTLVIITKPNTSQEVQEADMKDITAEAASVREQVQIVQAITEIPTDLRQQLDRAAIPIKTAIPIIIAVPAITTEPIHQQATLQIPIMITSVVPTHQMLALTLTTVSTHPTTTEQVRQR